MERKLTGILVDVENEDVKVIEIEDKLDEFYRILNCDIIDIAHRYIGDKRFNIVCDDEGLFKDEPKISAIDNLGNMMLVGNLFIVSGKNYDGELHSLSEEEIKHILARVHSISTHRYPVGYPMLTNCEY